MRAVIAAALALCERFPALGALPTPNWVTAILDASSERQTLQLQLTFLGAPRVAWYEPNHVLRLRVEHAMRGS